MPGIQVGNAPGVTGIAGKNINGGDDLEAGYTDADLATIATMRARLIALGKTTAEVNAMSYNDCMYAIRMNDAPTTVG